MLKRRTYLIFIIASILGCIPLTFYFTFTNTYLNEIGVQNAAGKMTLGQFSEIAAMLLMPWVFRRMSVRAIIMLGLLSWSLRYGLLAYRQSRRRESGCSISRSCCTGCASTFFFMTGQLYADQEAPANLRVTAQGFLTFVTYGVGMFIGSLLSGVALDFFTHDERRHGGPPVDRLLAEFGGRIVRDSADGGALLPEPQPDSDEGIKKNAGSLTRAPALNIQKRK